MQIPEILELGRMLSASECQGRLADLEAAWRAYADTVRALGVRMAQGYEAQLVLARSREHMAAIQGGAIGILAGVTAMAAAWWASSRARRHR